MRAVSRLFGVVAIGAVVAGAAGAQTCNGLPSLQTHKMNIGANAWFEDGATSIGGHFNTALSSLFLGLGAGITTYDQDGSDNATNFNANLGMEKGAKLSWCPQAVFDYTKIGDFSGKSIGGKLGLGYEAGGSSMKFIPFGHIGYYHELDTCDGCDANQVMFGGGLGIRFNNGMQISPQFKMSGREDSDAIFGATVTFPFGKK